VGRRGKGGVGSCLFYRTVPAEGVVRGWTDNEGSGYRHLDMGLWGDLFSLWLVGGGNK